MLSHLGIVFFHGSRPHYCSHTSVFLLCLHAFPMLCHAALLARRCSCISVSRFMIMIMRESKTPLLYTSHANWTKRHRRPTFYSFKPTSNFALRRSPLAHATARRV